MKLFIKRLVYFFLFVLIAVSCKKKSNKNHIPNQRSLKETTNLTLSSKKLIDDKEDQAIKEEESLAFSKIDIDLPSDSNITEPETSSTPTDSPSAPISKSVNKSPSIETPLSEEILHNSVEIKKKLSKLPSFNEISIESPNDTFKKQSKSQIKHQKDNLSKCSEGDFEACNRYGYNLLQKSNYENALNFFRVSCKNGIGKSCNNLGFSFERLKNLEEAKNFYSWSCLKKHKKGCENLLRVTEKIKASGSLKAH